MLGLVIIESVIGIVLVYLLLSLLVTTINELYFTYLNRLRSKTLLEGLESILSDNGDLTYLDKFKSHPLIKKKMRKGRFPSYISANTFGKVLTDIVGIYKKGTTTYEEVKESIDKLPEGDLKKMLQIWFNYSDNKLEIFHQNIEEWYEEVMDRVIGWYKRKVKYITLIVGFCVAALFNADSFYMVNRLAQDETSRKALVQVAEGFMDEAKQLEIKPLNETVKLDSLSDDEYKKKVEELNTKSANLIANLGESTNILGIGWDGNTHFEWSDSFWMNVKNILLRILGWFVTAIAITLGAPFWYDVLSKAIHIKGSGKTPKSDS